MPVHTKATLEFLSEHYIYEINMLRFTHALLDGPVYGPLAFALMESFHVHARTLVDFFRGLPRQDDAVAAHFIASGMFSGTATAGLPPDLRDRTNKQMAHLTYARGANKLNRTDRRLLREAIEKDHAAFKREAAPGFADCFASEVVDFSSEIPPHARVFMVSRAI